ncbi:hypothetical protein YYE_04949, partial [Plasmodium vinckei vinckei]
MEKSSYDIQKVYNDIFNINNYFYETEDGQFNVNTELYKYCHYENGSSNGHCINYFQMASSGVIHLVNNLKDMEGLEYDKLAEYAILWLSYKLNKKILNKMTDLKQFYTQYIEKNNYYNNKISVNDNSMTYKAIIDKKKDLIYMDNNEISKFNDLFEILYFIYYTFTKANIGCEGNLKLANNFVQNFEELNKNSNNKSDSYNKLLFTLSDDYKNLKEKCTNFKSLPEIKTSQSSAQNSLESSAQNSLESSAQNSLESSEEKSGKSSEEKSGKSSEEKSGKSS